MAVILIGLCHRDRRPRCRPSRCWQQKRARVVIPCWLINLAARIALQLDLYQMSSPLVGFRNVSTTSVGVLFVSIATFEASGSNLCSS